MVYSYHWDKLLLINQILICMTWLKIKKMGLFRRGANMNYTPLSLLRAAIQVNLNIVKKKVYFMITYVRRQS